MASYSTEVFQVEAMEHAALTAAIRSVSSSNGAWVNVEPVVDDSDRIEVPGIFAWFSARGPQVPVGTFHSGGPEMPASVGLDHGTGRGAGDRLTAGGVDAPKGWVLKQDHPKTGLVWELHPQNVDAEAVATLLLEGTAFLCPLQVEGFWTATLNRPR
ncbi:MAG: hypothetical protein ISR43_00220 [Acidimicrobiia bacterium]|nr:hypothetical protein [Actinomycetota bacterium]MBL6924044.1 hypothetical protein [Acidimicrobiia bacterium]MBL6925642.1 hypothetical protein [Acidimicrobiia bacterium]